MSVENSVHRLLELHQEYSPVDLLKAEGQLSKEGHRAWRSGEIASLDEAVVDAARARETLESALAFARRLELVPERVVFHGIGAIAGRELVASNDAHLNDLLVHRHRPGVGEQGDLFLEGARIANINALRHALTARDADRARKELRRTPTLVPGYRFLPHAEKLVAALQSPPPETATQAIETLECMGREWRPAALEFLGREQGATWLEPLWRNIGQALESAPFDPQRPDRHASYAFEQAREWRCLQHSVLAAPGFQAQPVLLQRLATAEFRLGHRTRALQRWFAMCRLAPDAFSNHVESSRFEDPGMAGAWQAAMADGDTVGELTAEWFPAWMLIHDPMLAHALPELNGESPPARAYNLVRALQRIPPEEQTRTGPDSIALRRALQQVHPGLQRSYLAYLARRAKAH